MKQKILTSSFLGLHDKLYRIAMRYLRDDDESKDVLQDAWLRLFDKDEIKSRHEAESLLVTVLRNLCIDRLRRVRPQSIDEPDNICNIPAVEMPTEDIPKLEKMLKAQLSSIQCKIFNYIVNEGMEYEEVAERLNMSVEAVRMNMSRARKKMRETYNKISR